jgi:hypothetical protein
MRKFPIAPVVITLVVLAVILSVYLVLKDFQKRAMQKAVDPFMWAPKSAEMVIHVKNPVLFRESLMFTGDMGHDIDLIIPHSRVYDFFLHLDSVLVEDENIYKIWKTSQLVLSVVPGSISSAENFVLQVSLPSVVDARKVSDFIQQYLSGNDSIYRIESPGGENKRVYHLKKQKAIWYSVRQNAIVVASDQGLLGSSDPELQFENSLLSEGRFIAIRSSAGRFSDNLFIQTRNLCDLMGAGFMDNNPLNVQCNQIAGWQMWDISYQASGLNLVGFAQAEAYGEKFIDNLIGQQRSRERIFPWIPGDVNMWFYLGLSDLERFGPDYLQWLQISENLGMLEGFKNDFRDVTGIDPDSLPAIWRGELAWVKPQSADSNLINQGVLVLEVDQIEDLMANAGLELFFSEFSAQYSHEELYAPLVFQINFPGFLPIISQGIINHDYRFVSWSDNYLFAASSPESLVAYLELLRFDHHFGRSDQAILMSEFMQENQGLFFYVTEKPESATDSVLPAREEGEKNDSVSGSKRSGSRSFGLQIVPGVGGVSFSNAMLMQSVGYEVSNPLVWEVALNAPVSRGPYRVINHNDGFAEIIVQDQSNQLYLIDIDGGVLWQKELSGPIMSDVFQVDVYKNDRYQYLFNTRNYLHLIDRNGDYVRGYPMRLPAPASAGINVFDYDNNKNYRILFPGENRRIYNYSLRRQPVEGWQYNQSANLVKQPVQYIRLDEKDFLMVADTTGRIEILDRRGLSRLRPKQPVSYLPGSGFFGHQPSGSKPFLLFAGEGGMVNQLFMDGSVFSFLPDSISDSFEFTCDTFTRSGDNDLVFLHKGNLTVHDIASRMIFSLALGRQQDAALEILHLNDKKKFAAITDKSNARLFLVNAKGAVVDQFPLQGDTKFWIESNDQDYYLIGGFQNFLRKYRVVL